MSTSYKMIFFSIFPGSRRWEERGNYACHSPHIHIGQRFSLYLLHAHLNLLRVCFPCKCYRSSNLDMALVQLLTKGLAFYLFIFIFPIAIGFPEIRFAYICFFLFVFDGFIKVPIRGHLLSRR